MNNTRHHDLFARTLSRPIVSFVAATVWATFLGATPSHAGDRPNILWITAEDMSPTLGCYGDAYAITPNIDRLAAESTKYTHAFATAPVCSPSRSCLITGCYAPSLGTHQMRSAFPIPRFMRGFPALLRDAGYYTSNNVKTDYNTANWQQIIRASWDESSETAHWRNRRDKDQPFFCVFNLMTSHQSRTMVWPREQFEKEVQSRLAPDEIHDPADAPLPPYYPDTPVIRRTLARYYDCVTAMDNEVGAILRQLDEDGLADDTIVFFYSDHGSGMPRHKRALLDSGMHVPLLIRFPEKYRHQAPSKPGATTDRLVSFVDFAPSVLSLAGVEIPDYMQGVPFLGERAGDPRKLVFGHRDRVDEVIDVARSVRDRRFLYIRNYMPHLGYNQPSAWPEQGEIRREFTRLADPQQMTAAQWHFAGPTRPVEELYDCDRDPHNIRNLASSAQHQEVLQSMRVELRRHLLESRDLGFLPESEAWKTSAGTTPWEASRGGKVDLERLLQAASAVGEAEEAVFVNNLQDKKPSVRYWGAVGLVARDTISEKARSTLQAALSDTSAAVRVEAANALARHGNAAAAMPVLTAALEHHNLAAVLHAARTIELLGDKARAAVPAMQMALARAKQLRPDDAPATTVQVGEPDMAMFIDFSASAFLSRVAKRDKEKENDWISLFDGKTLDGWNARAEGEVTVEDGAIHILSQGKNLWLVHERQLDDFELVVEAQMPQGGYNSGIGFRCAGEGGRPKGYQCEIEEQKSGMIYAIGSGWVWPKGPEETRRFREMAGDAFQTGAWNTFRIRCEGDRIQIWVNDVQTADVRDDRFRRGAVALQHHGKGDVHRFRNIRVREL